MFNSKTTTKFVFHLAIINHSKFEEKNMFFFSLLFCFWYRLWFWNLFGIQNIWSSEYSHSRKCILLLSIPFVTLFQYFGVNILVSAFELFYMSEKKNRVCCQCKIDIVVSFLILPTLFHTFLTQIHLLYTARCTFFVLYLCQFFFSFLFIFMLHKDIWTWKVFDPKIVCIDINCIVTDFIVNKNYYFRLRICTDTIWSM